VKCNTLSFNGLGWSVEGCSPVVLDKPTGEIVLLGPCAVGCWSHRQLHLTGLGCSPISPRPLEVLAKQAIHVFVAASLPRTVECSCRRSGVTRAAHGLWDKFVRASGRFARATSVSAWGCTQRQTKWTLCEVYAWGEMLCGDACRHDVHFGCRRSCLGRCAPVHGWWYWLSNRATEQPSNRAIGQLGNVPLTVVLLHEAGDGHAVFRLEVAIRILKSGHLLTLTDQLLHFTFESASCKL